MALHCPKSQSKMKCVMVLSFGTFINLMLSIWSGIQAIELKNIGDSFHCSMSTDLSCNTGFIEDQIIARH